MEILRSCRPDFIAYNYYRTNVAKGCPLESGQIQPGFNLTGKKEMCIRDRSSAAASSPNSNLRAVLTPSRSRMFKAFPLLLRDCSICSISLIMAASSVQLPDWKICLYIRGRSLSFLYPLHWTLGQDSMKFCASLLVMIHRIRTFVVSTGIQMDRLGSNFGIKR